MANKRPKRRTKTDLSLATLGEVTAAAPPFRERMEIARDELAAGVPEERIRARIITWAEDEGIAGPRALLPALTRKLLRRSAASVIREVADFLTSRAGNRKVGDFVSGWMEKLGFEDWLATYIIEWAKTGQPGDFFAGVEGRVFRQKLGFGPDAQDGVAVIASPLSDPRALAREFLAECQRTFPASTWSRYGADPQAARYFRRKVEGESYRDMAEADIGPDELARLRALGPRVAAQRITQDADRIRKKTERFAEFVWTLSPEELSD
jgi:hypothetical protein